MYDMGRVKIESMEDMESLLEGEWVEAPVGLHAKFVYSVDRENNRLTITLPMRLLKGLGIGCVQRLMMGRSLSVSYLSRERMRKYRS